MFRLRTMPALSVVVVCLSLILFSISCSTLQGSAGDGSAADRSQPTETQETQETQENQENQENQETQESIETQETIENAADVLEAFYTQPEDTEAILNALEDADVGSMDADSRLVYVIFLRGEGRLDESRDQLSSIVNEDPSRAAAWFNLALVEHAAGNETARDVALDTAIEADDTLAEAYAFRGGLAVQRADWEVAETSYKWALKLQPDSVESLVGLAWVAAKNELTDKALDLLNRAIELEPEFVYARVDRSRVNVALGNYNDAEVDLDFVIKQEPDVLWHYLDRARIRLRHFKDTEGALEDLENVERLDPDNFFALVYLAGLHEEERRFAASWDYYNRVVSMRPDYIWAFMPMGMFAWMRGDYDEAAGWFAKAAAEDPDEFSFSLMTALSLARAGKRQESQNLFSSILQQFKDNQAVYEVVRFCVEGGSDYYAVNALNKESNEMMRERLWFYMGVIYEMEGNMQGARTVFERIGPRTGKMEYDIAWAALNGMGD